MHARKHEGAAATERPRLIEDLQRTATERGPMPRFPFVRPSGIVHTLSFRSVSVHAALRTSPERVVVSTRNSNAGFTTGRAFDARNADATLP